MLAPGALALDYDSLLLDLDGVVYVGANAVPGAVDTIAALVAADVRSCYVTNNASRTPDEVAAHLASVGLTAVPSDVLTSAQAGAGLVAEQIPAGSTVLAVGGPGVAAALRAAGFGVVDAVGDPHPDSGDDVAAVLQGFGPDVGWRALARAAFAVHRGVPWVATNTDLTMPVEAGIAPGNGTLVAAVATATGRQPDVAGKPFPPLLLRAAEQTRGLLPLVVGDRLDTDIEGAGNAEMASLLVLSGVTGALALWRAPTSRRPEYLARDLTGLLQPPLAVTQAEDGSWRAGSAAAWMDQGRLAVDVDDDPVGAIWAAAHLLWQAGTEPDNAPDVAAELDAVVRRVPG